MKKFNLAFVTTFFALISVLLCACSFKKVEAKFSTNEIVVSQNSEIDLGSLLSVEGVKKAKVKFLSSDESLVTIEGSHAKTSSAYGKGFVYATYNQNTLATLQVFVRKPFDAPSEFTYSATGVLKWNVVVGTFEDKQTSATSYRVVGSVETEDGQTKQIDQTVTENQIQLSEVGKYSVCVQTLEEGIFAQSEMSQTQTLFFGFVDAPTNLNWSNGVFSWDAVAGAKYQVCVDDVMLSEQETTSVNLQSYLQALTADTVNVSVFVIDESGEKLSRQSDVLTITKLATPQATYDFAAGGQIVIPTMQNVEKYVLVVDGQEVGEIENTSSSIATTLDNIAQIADGSVHNLEIVAKNETGLFWQSDAQAFGKIYKLPKLSLAGNGGDLDGSTLNVTATGSSLVESKIYVSGVEAEFDGLSSDVSSASLALNIANVGQLSVSCKQKPASQDNEIEGSAVYVLQSSESDSVVLTRLAQIDEIVHAYSENVSVLTFAQIENATDYVLQSDEGQGFEDVEESEYDWQVADGQVKITLSKRIEDLVEFVEGKLTIRVIAKTEDDTVCINSSCEKELNELKSPVLQQREDTNNVVEWSEIEGATGYRYALYSMTKEQYDSDVTNVEELSLIDENSEMSEHQTTISQVNYYYITVEAYSESENEYVSSKQKLAQKFIYAVQLEMGELSFGYDAKWQNYETSSTSGYFIKIDGTENVKSYQIKIGEGEIEPKNDREEESVFLLNENFSDEKEFLLTVTGHGADDRLYLPATSTLTVTRLAKVGIEDLTLDNFKNASISVAKVDGASKLEVLKNSASFKSLTNDEDWKFEIEEFSSSTLTFALSGSTFDEGSHTYQIEGGNVFLPSGESTVSFERLATPTALVYDSGKLQFNNADYEKTKFYVLDIDCITPNEVSYRVSLRFTGVISVENISDKVFNVTLPDAGAISSSESSISVNVDLMLSVFQSLAASNDDLKQVFDIYNQAEKLTFNVYAVPEDGEERLVVSSAYAITNEYAGGVAKAGVTVDKMPSTKLSAIYDNESKELTLSWDELALEGTVTIHSDVESFKEVTVTGANQHTIGQADEYVGGSFWATVSKPNYITSAESNKVKIEKLSGVTSVMLTDSGLLSFACEEKDASHYSEIQLKVGEADKTEQIVGLTVKLSEVGKGTYVFTMIGSKEVNPSTQDTTFFLDAITTFTVEDLSALAPAAEGDVKIDGNELSWSAFGGDLSTLSYVVIFKDGTRVVKHETTSTSLNWKNDAELETKLSVLRSKVEICVFAKVGAYSVGIGGKIYYANEQALFEEEKSFNAYKYTTTLNLTKMTTPVVTNVEFKNMGEDESGELTPQINVTFKGNYGTTAKFNIYWGSQIIEGFEEKEISANEHEADGQGMFTYTFSLTSAVYENFMLSGGDKMVLYIYALNVDANQNAIPSSAGSVTISKVNTISELSMKDGKLGFDQTLVIKFNSMAHEPGDVILKIVVGEAEAQWLTVTNSNLASDTIEVSLVDFITKNVADGGEVKISAFVKSSNIGEYYLASDLSLAHTFNVLASVKNENITTTASGFSVVGINNATTTYFATYTSTEGVATTFELEEGKFITPNDWADKEYVLDIYAAEDGYVQSATTKVTVNLKRIAAVSDVKFSHDVAENVSEGKLSWSAVENAKSYILKASVVRAVQGDDENTSYEIVGNTYETELTSTSNTLEEIFGERYADFAAYVENFESDIMLQIDIITVPNESAVATNNSIATTFYVTLKGNDIQASDVVENQHGMIVLNKMKEDVTLLYRLVEGSGEVLQAWKKMESALIDTSAMNAEQQFYVQVMVMGSESATTAQSMAFDSVIVASKTFFKLANILQVRRFTEQDKLIQGPEGQERIETDDDLMFELGMSLLNSTRIDKLLVGVSADAVKTEKYISLAMDDTWSPTKFDTTYIYTYKLANLIEQLETENIWNGSGSCTLHVWAYKAADDTMLYVNSNAATFTFNVEEQAEEMELFRLGEYHEVSESGVVAEALKKDYVNTYVLLQDKEGTTGAYVKVTFSLDDGSKATETMYVDVQEMIARNDILRAHHKNNTEKGYVIDILSVLDSNVRTADAYGEIEISIARTVLTGETYTISKWTVMDFVRIQSTPRVSVTLGNLAWDVAGEETTQYNVFLFSDLVSNSYTVAETTGTSIDATTLVGAGVYYVAVQSLNIVEADGKLTDKSLHTLSSKRVFVMDEELKTPAQIYRNQISSPLKLKDGRLFFDWDLDGDFFQTLKSDGNLSDIAEELATSTFTSPFTFTLTDVVNEGLYLRMRFTPKGADGTYKNPTTVSAVKATDLLADLLAFAQLEENGQVDVLSKLTTLAEANSTYRTRINAFAEFLQNASCGIANHITIFDDYFEGISAGRYKLEYSLVGATRTLNSQWYAFENENGTEDFYVNPQPVVRASVSSSEKLTTTYQIKIIKSDVYGENGTTSKANNYVMRLGDLQFEISAGGVALFGSDVAGREMAGVVDDGTSLTFFINHNNGNSLLGKFNENVTYKNELEMQVYAVGTNFSSSSKSEKFTMKFLQFGDISLNDGVFTWETQDRLTTSILIQSVSTGGTEQVEKEGTEDEVKYALDAYDPGKYTISFVVKGKIENDKNLIVIDSDILMVENVQKLDAPTLTNVNGLIAIEQKNDERLSKVYSQNQKYRYLIFNDNSTENVSYTFTDGRDAHNTAYLFEPGVTGMSESDGDDYAYKNTEEFASLFSVKMLGSSAELEQIATSDYHIKKLQAKNASEEQTDVALQSAYGTLSASMMDMVYGMSVSNGMLTWDAVTSRTVHDNVLDQQITYEVPIDEGTDFASPEGLVKVVYKLSVTAYTKNGDETLNFLATQIFTTINTTFDMSKMQVESDYADDEIFYDVTIQAYAMKVSTVQRMDSVALDDMFEGERLYASGHVTYKPPIIAPADGEASADQTAEELFVLIGNGKNTNELQRYNAVDDLAVENGKLTWKYTTGSHIQRNNFAQYYAFVVKDENGNVIEGTYDLSEPDQDNTFTIVFTENKGEISPDNTLISVIVTQGTGTGDVRLNSYSKSIEAKKLGVITNADYDIETDVTSETLVLSIPKDSTYTVVATVKSTGQTFNFTALQNKLFIFASADELASAYPDGYIRDYLIIGKEERVEIEFQLTTQEANVLYGDVSETFLFYRSSWDDNKIEWNSTEQYFTWKYDYRSFKSATTGLEIQNGEPSEIEHNFVGSEVVKIVSQDSTNTIISYDDGTGERQYQVAASSIADPTYIISARFMHDGETTTRTYINTVPEFVPTIIGQVSISVRVKINNVNLQSEELEFSQVNPDEPQAQIHFVDFNLFESGFGTAEKPYIINTAEQFANINHRMQKTVVPFTESDGSVGEEDEVFHFSIASSLNLGDIATLSSKVGEERTGILFKGEFNGVISGQESTITYSALANEELSGGSISIKETNVVAMQGDSTVTFTHGASLFEKLGAKAKVENLKISASFGQDISNGTRIYANTLVSGLALENAGEISNVTVTNFASTFVGTQTEDAVIVTAYSGLVAINRNKIENCVMSATVAISDFGNGQVIFLAGIAYTNYGTVDSCSTAEGSSLSIRSMWPTDQLQLSGIVTTNASATGVVSNCTNNATLSVIGAGGGTVYVAGILALNQSGTYSQGNANKGTISVIDVTTVVKDDVCAVNK